MSTEMTIFIKSIQHCVAVTYFPSTASVSAPCRPKAAIDFNILVLLSRRRLRLIRKIWRFERESKLNFNNTI